MSKVLIEEETLSNIGNAIREKTNITDLISPLDMPTKISEIQSGGSEDMLQHIVNEFNSCEDLFYNSKLTDSTFLNKLDTSNVTNMTRMFAYSKFTSIPKLDTHNVTTMNGMCNSSRIDIFPECDTSKVTDMSYMFGGSSVSIIHRIDMSNVTNTNSMFYSSVALREFHAFGLKVNLALNYSNLLERTALVEILTNLGVPETTKTLTLGSTNLGKLTDDDKQIAFEKNWQLK